MSKAKKILIVGAGIAGTFLAAECCKAGHDVILCDDNKPASASRVAAGLFNVITGRIAAKTWLAETLHQHLLSFFEKAPFDQLKPHLHFETIYRPFFNIFEVNEWTGKSADAGFESWVEIQPSPILPEIIKNPVGGLLIKKCGWVNVPELISGIQDILKKHYSFEFLQNKFDYNLLDLPAKTVIIEGESIQWDEIVFAEGVSVEDNPYFQEVEVRPLKGHILTVEIPDFQPDFILSRKLYFIPVKTNVFIVGASYEREFDTAEVTKSGIASISVQISEMIHLPFKVLDAKAGIRPTTVTRRPIVGTHPQHSALHIVNGMGTKGILQSPYFAIRFLQYLGGNHDSLSREVLPDRFYK